MKNFEHAPLTTAYVRVKREPAIRPEMPSTFDAAAEKLTGKTHFA